MGRNKSPRYVKKCSSCNGEVEMVIQNDGMASHGKCKYYGRAHLNFDFLRPPSEIIEHYLLKRSLSEKETSNQKELLMIEAFKKFIEKIDNAHIKYDTSSHWKRIIVKFYKPKKSKIEVKEHVKCILSSIDTYDYGYNDSDKTFTTKLYNLRSEYGSIKSKFDEYNKSVNMFIRNSGEMEDAYHKIKEHALLEEEDVTDLVISLNNNIIEINKIIVGSMLPSFYKGYENSYKELLKSLELNMHGNPETATAEGKEEEKQVE